jgi:formate hydrogenlyase subunit 4
MNATMTTMGIFSQLAALLTALLLAPLLSGWVNQWRAWLQNKSAPGLLQPYRHAAQAVQQGVGDGRARLAACTAWRRI